MEKLSYTEYASPVGRLELMSDGTALTGLWIAGQKYERSTVGNRPCVREELPVLSDARKWLDSYFRGQKPTPDLLPLNPEGSDFRKAVWQLLLEIPYGETVTYGYLAERIAASRGLARMSAQAVGGAVGHNPIAIIIPCHRVLGAGGSLTGYAGGLGVKQFLLNLEGVSFHE